MAALEGDPHVALRAYLSAPGASIAALAQAGADANRRVISAVYAIFGPYHAVGGWSDIADRVYVPVCTVMCLDKAAKAAIKFHITYDETSTSTSNIKVKVAGVGFGGSMTKTVKVSSSYPNVPGTQQIVARAYLQAREYRHSVSGEIVYRLRIRDIGTSSHIDDFSGDFVVPDVAQWVNSGEFGSSVAKGTEDTYTVENELKFDASVPVKIKKASVDLSYSVTQSNTLKVKAVAESKGRFDVQKVVRAGAAFALKFKSLAAQAGTGA
ncbi:MAG: hypothetical protein AAFN09_00305 [Pseudomonadota bacterium]